MSAISTALRLVFVPGTIEPVKEPKPRESRKIEIGGLLGLLGFIIHGMYIIPKDEISFRDVSQLAEEALNTAAGAAIGLVLFSSLVGFDALVLGLLGVRGYRSPLYGSVAPFIAMPLTCIPIHELFSDFLSQRGFYALVFVLIAIFLAWHIVTLFILLSRGFASTRFETRRRVLALCVLLLGVEIACATVFLTQVPMLFDSTLITFLEEYF